VEIASINELAKQGIFAALFIVLFIYVIKNQKERETLLYKTIDDLSTKIYTSTCSTHDVTKGITQDVELLDTKLHNMSEKVDQVDKKIDHVIDKLDLIDRKF
jgi:uncharacterized protein YoxC